MEILLRPMLISKLNEKILQEIMLSERFMLLQTKKKLNLKKEKRKKKTL